MFKTYFQRMAGIQNGPPPRRPISEIAWSWLGAFIGLLLLGELSQFSPLTGLDHIFLIGSFGASAVLIYGAPQVEYAQPRNLVGGHIISAAIGVTLYQYVPLAPAVLAALAVSVSIAVMHLTRTVHPPGGASALIAVIGSERVHAEAYYFAVTTVAVGALLMLVVALLVNNLSANPKRRYPVFWY